VVKVKKVLRWDKADLAAYYSNTGAYLYPIFQELVIGYVEDNHGCEVSDFINRTYSKIIHALLCFDGVVPRASNTQFKHWWNDSLDKAKQNSIKAFQVWKDAGKPDGDLLREMKRAKKEFKDKIKKSKEDKSNIFSANLSDAFLQKDKDNFWKSWNSKFRKKN